MDYKTVGWRRFTAIAIGSLSYCDSDSGKNRSRKQVTIFISCRSMKAFLWQVLPQLHIFFLFYDLDN